VKPTATILAPKAGDVFSDTVRIDYSTQNTVRTNLYYSDKIAEWFGELVYSTYKISITEGVMTSGPYAWDTKGLAPGNFYRIIINVFGLNGLMGEAVSDLFSLDFTPPTFIVKADPAVTRGKDVTVSVDASENLKEPPAITVTQAGGVTMPLVMQGQGSHYEGTYVVKKGYDGVAAIAVSGADVAGNVGTTTVSGGTFAVGVNPPPAPSISAPQNNIVVGTSTIAVAGSLPRADTVAVLLVNGVDTYVASSSPSGAFAFANIRLSKSVNHGLNILSIAARDITGLMSEAVPLSVKYNVAPTVAIASPAEKAVVSAATLLTARTADENTDPLSFTYQIILAQSFDAAAVATSSKNEWDTIGDAVPSASFSWDSTDAEDGQYFLRIIADDGFVKVYSAPVPFSIYNTLPFFRFEDGRKTLTNQSSVTIIGRAITPSAFSPRSTVKTVEYSIDNGKKWKSIPPTSGAGTPEARFSVPFTNLTEGTQSILWRVKDSRGFYGRTSHPVIVDTTPPKVPLVNYPANNAFITNADDENASRDGLQISVAGTAEPQSTVTLQTENATTTVKAKVDGSFVFRSVDVQHRGANQVRVTAADAAGNKSAASVANVTYDNPPAVSILSPKPFRGLAGKALVSWSVSDADDDPIRGVALEYRRGQGAFIPLAVDNQSVKHSVLDTFLFDVSRFPEAADYQLRLSAGDGMATGTDIVNFSVDATPPVLSSFTLDASVLGKGATLRGRGTARDALSGIEYVEYAIAQGEPASFSTALLTNGFLQENATFTFKHPTTLPDAIYTVYARAVDAAGNVSPALSRAITVDTSPPRIGSFDVLAQGVRIAPDGQGIISLYANMNTLFEVSLEGDTDTASLSLGTTTVPLKKDIASGLWRAPVDIGTLGTTTFAISARDKVRNAFTRRPLGAFSVIERPVVAPPTPKAGGGFGFLKRIINYLLSL
jgi:large repetitive protein